MTRPILIPLLLSIAFAGSSAARAAGDPDLEAKLADARQRLEAAAKDLAELSAEMSGPLLRNLINEGFARPVIGVQLDPEGGSEGARVTHVSPGGPAASAGMRTGDVIVAVAGESMTGKPNAARAVTDALRAAAPEEPVKIRVLRDGKAQELSVVPRPLAYGGRVFAGPRALTMPLPSVTPLPSGDFMFSPAMHAISGLEFVTLTPGLGEYFGADKGVLVVRAPKDGALGLREGDVIREIGGREPQSSAHATRIIASYQPGESVPITVLRKKQSVALNSVLPQ
ncbi:MAG TPA: PDZ domain-containing protein [Steroidobacteraceae bacterium]|nr:PDZ domain-containing protein [Steroidobacteraceae bacterium]HNS28327.1 PDZ domain-containing protein [Steroidobacteraceae bacterium]